MDKKIKRFFLLEKIIFIIMIVTFIIGIIGGILILLLYKYYDYNNSIYFNTFVKIIVSSIILSVVIGIIHANRPRRCPVCKRRMERIAPINETVRYRCNEHNIEVNTYIPNSPSAG